jgi:hypothetical protein
MIGYQAIAQALKNKAVLTRAFIYVDVSPLLPNLPVGVCVVNPDEQPEKLRFDALKGIPVHINGADEKRIREFAERVKLFNPKLILLNWHEAMEIWE